MASLAIEERESFSKKVGNGALPSKLAPFWLLGEPFFNKKWLETAPLGHQNSATLQKGAVSNLFWKMASFSLKGHYYSGL